ncbi:MAG: DoxX family membrane protein [Chloroflexia bacterium]|nr:DoxX family membrane protein [Chloroflexia bacterium]
MKKIILLIVSILFGLMFINSGLNKFFQYMPMPEDIPEEAIKMMTAMMEMKWLMPLLAISEIIGGLLFMIPKFRALGAIVIFPVMIGIVLTHLIVIPSGLLMAIILMVVNLWIIVENWNKYLPMIKSNN